MQTLPLVNPCSGGTDTDKSSLRQNPYLVNPGDIDSNTDQSPLSQNPYLVDSGNIGRNNDLQFLEHPKTISLPTNRGFLGLARHAGDLHKLSTKVGAAGQKGTRAMDRASHKVVGKYSARSVGGTVGRGIHSAGRGAVSLVKMVARAGLRKKTPK